MRANSEVAGEALPANEGVVDCSALDHIERAAGFGFGMPVFWKHPKFPRHIAQTLLTGLAEIVATVDTYL